MTTLFIPTKSEDQISHESIKEDLMTETEKLISALLAEALNEIRGRTYHSHGCEGQCSTHLLIDRIAAALAEPVSDSTAVRLQRVRKALTAAVPADGTIGNADDVSRVARLVAERDEARAEFAAAYQRGAEAMREAAATAVLTRFHLSSVTLAQSIRNLPIPEDKR